MTNGTQRFGSAVRLNGVHPNRRRLAATALAVLVLFVTACSDDEDDEGGAASTISTSTSTPPTTGTTTPSPEASDEELTDGRHFGYLVSDDLESTATVVSFDLAELLTGAEAEAAAAEDGAEVENDFYIRNRNDRLRTVRLRDDAAVRVVDCEAGCELVVADRATLQNRPTPTPVWLTVADGVVTAVEEQYLP